MIAGSSLVDSMKSFHVFSTSVAIEKAPRMLLGSPKFLFVAANLGARVRIFQGHSLRDHLLSLFALSIAKSICDGSS